ncbi:12741_t:CDS:2 [Ambispora leptoticha]|uniref:12741_t:CDS:1 n=1 Tax=Ambispora leptoticha TaxID=144679 RepID=A0A9N8VBT7_9GLOM|nr:12741_t:CDS:2 [Ambispora leptoticha]
MASKTHPEPNNSFLVEISQIEQSINDIQKNISLIKNLQDQLLISTSAYQARSFASQRDDLLNSTRTLLINVKDRIKKIEYENTRIPSTNPEFGLRKQRHQYLKEKFTNILDDYRGLEDQYMRQHMERLARQYRVVNPEATEAEISDYLSNPSNEPVFQTALLRSGEAREALAEVQKRHEDIKQIEATITELAQLFQEMQLQVEAQDEVLVAVEENVDVTLIKTEKAEEDHNNNENNASASTVTVTKSFSPTPTVASAASPSKTVSTALPSKT